MKETRYSVFEIAEPKAEPISLLKISGDRAIITSLRAFGSDRFDNNVSLMQKEYSNPSVGGVFSFREPTTAESILAASHDLERNSVSPIQDCKGLQLGRMIRTSEGVIVNPYPAFRNDPSISEKQLKYFLKHCKKVNGIWLDSSKYDFGFAPYESFKQGIQDVEEFAEGGLARVLEHTEGKKAEILGEIASKKNYPGGVEVEEFGLAEKPELDVIKFRSRQVSNSRRLFVQRAFWRDREGYAFGVLREK